MRRNLKTVPELASETPFTQGQIRWFIFNAENNGLAKCGAVVRVGRRVYIDADLFLGDWIDSQNHTAPAAA